MATYQSVRSGDWSSSSTWSPTGVPGDGDTVIINSGHEVLFDVDQSSFPNGLASVTINGTLRFPTASGATTALKVTGNISGSGALYVGNSLDDRIPRDSSASIIINSASSLVTVATQRYYGWTPARHYTFLAADSQSGSNTITLVDDLDLLAGDLIVVGSSAVVGNMTEASRGVYSVSAYNGQSKTVSLASALGHARYAGDVVGVLARPIRIRRLT